MVRNGLIIRDDRDRRKCCCHGRVSLRQRHIRGSVFLSFSDQRFHGIHLFIFGLGLDLDTQPRLADLLTCRLPAAQRSKCRGRTLGRIRHAYSCLVAPDLVAVIIPIGGLRSLQMGAWGKDSRKHQQAVLTGIRHASEVVSCGRGNLQL
jgi:hypothetical protein